MMSDTCIICLSTVLSGDCLLLVYVLILLLHGIIDHFDCCAYSDA